MRENSILLSLTKVLSVFAGEDSNRLTGESAVPALNHTLFLLTCREEYNLNKDECDQATLRIKIVSIEKVLPILRLNE